MMLSVLSGSRTAAASENGRSYKTKSWENTPVRYNAIFHGLRNEILWMKQFDFFFFLIYVPNIDLGRSLESLHRNRSTGTWYQKHTE